MTMLTIACPQCGNTGTIKMNGAGLAGHCHSCDTSFHGPQFQALLKQHAAEQPSPLGAVFTEFVESFKAKHPQSTVFPGHPWLTTDAGWADPKSYLAPNEALYKNVSGAPIKVYGQEVGPGETIKVKAGSVTENALSPDFEHQVITTMHPKIDHVAPECLYAVGGPMPAIGQAQPAGPLAQAVKALGNANPPPAKQTYWNVSPKKVYVGGMAIDAGAVFVTMLAEDQQQADKLVAQKLMTLALPCSPVQSQAALYQHFCANPLCQYHPRLVPPRIAYALKSTVGGSGLSFLSKAQFAKYHAQFGLDLKQVVRRHLHTADLGGFTVEDYLCATCSNALITVDESDGITTGFAGDVPFCSNHSCDFHNVVVAPDTLWLKAQTKTVKTEAKPADSFHPPVLETTQHYMVVQAHKISVPGGYLRFCDCCQGVLDLFGGL